MSTTTTTALFISQLMPASVAREECSLAFLVVVVVVVVLLHRVRVRGVIVRDDRHRAIVSIVTVRRGVLLRCEHVLLLLARLHPLLSVSCSHLWVALSVFGV